MNDALIAIDDLRVFARGRLVLRVDELRVERGEVLGVLGPNRSEERRVG